MRGAAKDDVGSAYAWHSLMSLRKSRCVWRMRKAFASAIASGSLYAELNRFWSRSTKLSSCDFVTLRAEANWRSS